MRMKKAENQSTFLPFFDTQHLIYKFFILFVGGSQVVPEL